MTGINNVAAELLGHPALKPRARALLNAAEFAGNLTPHLERPYLIKGWLDRMTISVVYGPSNVGKSFLALDIAHHVAKGRGWGGRRVSRGKVLYIAAEGGGSFDNRVQALDDPEFWVLKTGVTMIGRQSDAAPLAEMMAHLADTGGARFDLIVIDTLARVMGGGDENTAPDIADLVENLDGLRRATGAHIMLIHHSGKDLARGARGHSSLRAAIDTEIVLSRDDATGPITAVLDKQRDGPTGYKFVYTLRQVELGRDQDGDLVTTCLVEPGAPAEAGRAEATGPALVALETLDKVIADRGEVHRKPTYPGGKAVPIKDWRAACDAAGLTISDHTEAKRKAFNRARADLEKVRLVVVRDDLAWRVES